MTCKWGAGFPKEIADKLCGHNCGGGVNPAKSRDGRTKSAMAAHRAGDTSDGVTHLGNADADADAQEDLHRRLAQEKK